MFGFIISVTCVCVCMYHRYSFVNEALLEICLIFYKILNCLQVWWEFILKNFYRHILSASVIELGTFVSSASDLNQFVKSSPKNRLSNYYLSHFCQHLSHIWHHQISSVLKICLTKHIDFFCVLFPFNILSFVQWTRERMPNFSASKFRV